MSKFKVVVTDHQFDNIDIEKSILEPIGADVFDLQSTKEEDVINECSDADALLNLYAPMNEKVLSELKKCKIIVRYGVGFDNVDLSAATKYGIFIANVREYGDHEVSTHAMALLLACARKIVDLNKCVKKKSWSFQNSKPIFRLWENQTVGLIGFGSIARYVATKSQAFGLNVMAYDPYISKDEMKKLSVNKAELDELLRQSDFVSVHAPLNEHTRHLISEEQFKIMKSTAFIINTARGAVIDEKALYKALKEGWIAGAGIDVMEQEPPEENNPLYDVDSAIITPHAAYYSEESLRILREQASKQVVEVLQQSKAPRFLVNTELGE